MSKELWASHIRVFILGIAVLTGLGGDTNIAIAGIATYFLLKEVTYAT